MESMGLLLQSKVHRNYDAILMTEGANETTIHALPIGIQEQIGFNENFRQT